MFNSYKSMIENMSKHKNVYWGSVSEKILKLDAEKVQ